MNAMELIREMMTDEQIRAVARCEASVRSSEVMASVTGEEARHVAASLSMLR